MNSHLRLAPLGLGVLLLLLRRHIGRRLVEDALKDAVRHAVLLLLLVQLAGAVIVHWEQ